MMFQVKYFMDMNRYRHWTCPPAHKTKGFLFWLILLVVAVPCFVIFRMNNFDLRMQSMAGMLGLVALYRGFLFRPMYANKQFRIMCINYHKEERQGWDSRVDVTEEGIHTYMDDELRGTVLWDQVKSYTVTSKYVDFNVMLDFIRLPKDCFTVGTAEEIVAWMEEHHPEIERQKETSEFDN